MQMLRLSENVVAVVGFAIYRELCLSLFEAGALLLLFLADGGKEAVEDQSRQHAAQESNPERKPIQSEVTPHNQPTYNIRPQFVQRVTWLGECAAESRMALRVEPQALQALSVTFATAIPRRVWRNCS